MEHRGRHSPREGSEEVDPLKKRLLALLLGGTIALSAGCGAGPRRGTAQAAGSSLNSVPASPENTAAPGGSYGEAAPDLPDPWPQDAAALADVDWTGFREVMSPEEYAALEGYLPVLTGQETFLWSEDGARWFPEDPPSPYPATIEMFRQTIAGDQDLLILGVGTPDLDGDGTRELALYLASAWGHHLILHREEDLCYGTDRSVRAFGDLQANGIYTGSSGSSWTDWCRMDCRGGAFTEEILGRIRPNEDPETLAEDELCYYIGEEMVDREAFFQWVEANAPGTAYYVPEKG